MKWVRDATGRLRERPHYTPEELDRECEALLASRRAPATYPLTTDDLTVLLEAHTSDLDLFADLSADGPGVEGVTEFTKEGPPRVRISAALSESARSAHRLRTTLAHELGHVRFHSFLWSGAGKTHGGADTGPVVRRTRDVGAGLQGVRCLRDSISRPRGADWLEWQASYASGAILMPSTALRRAIAELGGGAGPQPLYSRFHAARRLVRHVTRTFDVSETAARIRLTHVGALTDEVPTALRSAFLPRRRPLSPVR